MQIGSFNSREFKKLLSETFDHETDRIERFFKLNTIIYQGGSCEQIVKKVRFWGYELQNTSIQFLDPRDKVVALRNFIFDDKKIVSSLFHNPDDFFKVELFLMNKKAHPIGVGLLMQSLGQFVGLNFVFVRLGPKIALKVVDKGESLYVDLEDQGKVMSFEDIIELLNQQAHNVDSFAFEPLTYTELVYAYLESIKVRYEYSLDTLKRLHLWSCILTIRDGDVGTLLKRALLLRDLGLAKEALSDLKRCFLLNGNAEKDPTLKTLIKDLVCLIKGDRPTTLH